MTKIIVLDGQDVPNAEDLAMLQALYSRSSASVTDHLEKVRKAGSGAFLQKYLVNFGHASIGDCGTTTLFFEDVSILAVKAIQDWQLYNGQETSSRYIDMSRQRIVDPLATPAARAILDRWMAFYTDSQAAVAVHIRATYPRKPDEDEAVYDKAVKARTFDILRGFLPAGITTQCSWHTNLRQAHDHLSLMLHHPLLEVRGLAEAAYEQLREKYPSSFSHKIYPEQESYRAFATQAWTYWVPPPCEIIDDVITINDVLTVGLETYKGLLLSRPPKTNLPAFLASLGNVTFTFQLDYGSFRDIQRHRNGVCRMPLLDERFGFHYWYIEQLPANLAAKAARLVEAQAEAICGLESTPTDRQYYYAMGFKVPCQVTYGLPAAVYVAELRSGRHVHPTLRRVAHKMVKDLRRVFPDLTLHADLTSDDWDVRRGTHDITSKVDAGA